MKDTYNMSKLQTDYGNFMVPDFRIKVDGSQVQRSGKSGNVLIDNVRIKLSADAAGSLTFRILNAYDLEKRAFDSNVKAKFKPGKTITAEIGYAGSLTQIFKGYIHSINFEYSDVPEISVTAVDLIRLMQENEVLKKVYDDVTPTDAFRKVMEFYQKICPASDIEAKSSDSKKRQIIQKENDYKFITEVLCPMEDREFLVLNGKAYFISVDDKKTSMIDLEWGKDIISFSYEQQYLEKKIRINLVNKEKEVEGLLYEKKISKGNQKSVLSSPVVKNISMNSVGTQADAKLQAKKTEKEEKRQTTICSGSCMGIPQIVPGRSLTIKKIDDLINGTYEIVSVEHSIGTDGFTTQFELGGKV